MDQDGEVVDVEWITSKRLPVFVAGGVRAVCSSWCKCFEGVVEVEFKLVWLWVGLGGW